MLRTESLKYHLFKNMSKVEEHKITILIKFFIKQMQVHT